MDIKAWMNDKIEGAILGNLAKGLDAGKYGPRAQAVYRFGKGYVTWTAGALSLIFAAASFFDNTGAALVAAQVSAGLAGLGLVRKGAHMEPPQLPQEMRDALEAGLSIVTWLLMAANGVVYICQQLHASWVCGVSGEAQTISLALTAVSGFLATYVSDGPPKPTAQVPETKE